MSPNSGPGSVSLSSGPSLFSVWTPAHWGDDPHDGSTDTPWASLMPDSRAFTPSLHSHIFLVCLHTLVPDFGANFHHLGHRLAGCSLGKFLRNPQEIWSWAPFPYSRPQRSESHIFLHLSRAAPSLLQASGMREPCQRKSKIMQLNYKI